MADNNLTANQRGDAEQIIRDLAGNVLSLIANRKDHPSHGVTKTMIREAEARVEGAIGMYQVMTGQSMHPHVPGLVEFQDSMTTGLVRSARNAAR